ncbi:MAG: prefoldin subunit alpha [Candidatus Woesearchaeota archaeon]|jgi:prefoldin alpha subunit|nr:prefoldin subunit alpha [Candidatus Woesearchaeota archaeon]MDP6265932.1 prefoldin subunit alpha [Candidatus Woesearchaeota archaeon]MDP7476331.1 prefoldin subunit alpha [Candidatus Woesearchaeota archaeon]HJO02259.1 prefoldin subunit alpha [Candidatus Woesearchaeota archaeon]|tara:strand:- start:1065 stop:1487 length:423 start_codon:yes stop_codon:yes gene_type:complete
MKEKEEKLQKLYMEFQVLEQQIKQLEKQNTMLNNQLMELMMTNQGLEDTKKIKEGTEILTPLSSGIYAKAQLKDSKNLIVNVGSSITVVKDVNSAKKMIEDQIEEIKKLQENLVDQLQTQTTKAASLEQEINTIASEIKK